MGKSRDQTFPLESKEYREARDELLAEEINLRRHLEGVAALRRKLPLGGRLKEDYVFEEGNLDLSDQKTVKQIKLSSIFAQGKNSLIIYSFMYDPEETDPYPLCASILDGLNGVSPHVWDRVNFVVVAKAPKGTIPLKSVSLRGEIEKSS